MIHKQPKSKYLLYGIHPTLEALREHKSIEKILLRKGNHESAFNEMFKLIRDENIPFQYVPVEKLNRLTKGNHQGVVCLISPIEYESIFDIIPHLYENGKVPFLMFLDKITDVRNLGAISRTAACAGVDAIIIPAKNTAGINEDAIKSSSGALNKIPICRHDNTEEVLTYLKECGIKLIACSEKAKNKYCEQDYNYPLCVIMGSENEGVSESCMSMSDIQIYIPMKGEIESLNVSVASGIILFEILRQRFYSAGPFV